jgi:hypothetical protein
MHLGPAHDILEKPRSGLKANEVPPLCSNDHKSIATVKPMEGVCLLTDALRPVFNAL